MSILTSKHTESLDITQMETLSDRRQNGDERPWRLHKTNSIKLADLYAQMIYDKLAHKFKKKSVTVSGCADTLLFDRFSDGTKKLAGAFFCKARLCPMCSWRKSIKNAAQLLKVVLTAKEENPRLEYLFLTLTQSNVKGWELRNEMNRLSHAFKLFTKNVKFKRAIKGYYKAIEITHGAEDTYHPHHHVLLAVDRDYFKSYYISQAKWTEMWKQALGMEGEQNPIVHIERVKEGKKGKDSLTAAVSEVSKYVTKSADWLGGSETEQMIKVKFLTEALEGMRLTSYGGILKEIHKKLKMQDSESDNVDLIRTESEEGESQPDDQTIWIGRSIYKWFGGNYFGGDM